VSGRAWPISSRARPIGSHTSSWRAEAEHLLAQLPGRDPVHLVAGSNGCSTALRLALDHAARVRSLALCWPATAGDARIDAVGRRLIERTRPEAADALLAGETVRGVRDAELRSLRLPVAVLPAAPPDPAHPARTVAALADLIPGCRELADFPLPFAPGFADALPSFRGALLEFLEAL
jgi:pimeloyl-ACP methyl ester carboxylesterase